MVNGFVNEGNLASPRIKKIVPKMQFFLKLCQQKNIARYAVNDAHTSSSLEFNSYPSHCLFGSDESNLISELLTYDLTIINKNSTNAFFMLQGLDF
jgi:nicotinamidase-related amidase